MVRVDLEMCQPHFTDHVGKDALLKSALALAHCNRPSMSEYKSVENFVHNRQPLVSSEQSFVYRREDLITLRPGREHTWLDYSVEKLLKCMKCKFIHVRNTRRHLRPKRD